MQYTYQLDYMESPAQTPDDAPPAGIIIHWWGALGQSHDGVARYLSRPGANTSAHYVVSGGRVTCLVDPMDTAWHAGTWPANVSQIGIECRPEMSADDFETVAECIAWLRAQFGPLPLSGHRDHYPTECPGVWYDQLDRLSQRADEILNGAPIHTPRKEKKKMITIISTATPWGAEAHARLHAINGARALEGQEAASAIKTYGQEIVPWDWWNLEIRQAWQDHEDHMKALGKAMAESIDEATARVVAAATGKQG